MRQPERSVDQFKSVKIHQMIGYNQQVIKMLN